MAHRRRGMLEDVAARNSLATGLRQSDVCIAHLCPPTKHGRLHYAKPTFHGEKLEDAPLYRGLSAIAEWREANRGARPQMVWVDTPPQVNQC